MNILDEIIRVTNIDNNNERALTSKTLSQTLILEMHCLNIFGVKYIKEKKFSRDELDQSGQIIKLNCNKLI